jgi:hypothetical protein
MGNTSEPSKAGAGMGQTEFKGPGDIPLESMRKPLNQLTRTQSLLLGACSARAGLRHSPHLTSLT